MFSYSKSHCWNKIILPFFQWRLEYKFINSLFFHASRVCFAFNPVQTRKKNAQTKANVFQNGAHAWCSCNSFASGIALEFIWNVAICSTDDEQVVCEEEQIVKNRVERRVATIRFVIILHKSQQHIIRIACRERHLSTYSMPCSY